MIESSVTTEAPNVHAAGLMSWLNFLNTSQAILGTQDKGPESGYAAPSVAELPGIFFDFFDSTGQLIVF